MEIIFLCNESIDLSKSCASICVRSTQLSSVSFKLVHFYNILKSSFLAPRGIISARLITQVDMFKGQKDCAS
jgi:hypothetical protein